MKPHREDLNVVQVVNFNPPHNHYLTKHFHNATC